MRRGAGRQKSGIELESCSAAYAAQCGRRRTVVYERDGVYAAATAFNVCSADDVVGRPVAALDENVGLHELDQGKGCVVIEPADQADRLERSDQRHAVVERIDWTFGTFAEPTHGIVAVDRHQQAGAQGACLRQVVGVAAMQNIKDAVGKNQRTCQRGDAALQLFRRTQFGFESGGGIHARSVAKVRANGIRSRGLGLFRRSVAARRAGGCVC